VSSRGFRSLCFIAILLACATLRAKERPASAASGSPGAASSTESEITATLPKVAEVLARAEAALADAGTIKADVRMEVWYPAHSTSRIELYATEKGDERANIITTVNEDTYTSLEVISGGVIWMEQDTPGGRVASKIDTNEVKKALAGENARYAALPWLGANALFDLAAMSKFVEFTDVKGAKIDSQDVFVLAGGLPAKPAPDAPALPKGAERYYKSVAVWVRASDYLPARVELGIDQGKPAVRLDFAALEKNAAAPEGAFAYAPPAGAEVVDRTAWAVEQLKGK